jgi:hypothetical protein
MLAVLFALLVVAGPQDPTLEDVIEELGLAGDAEPLDLLQAVNRFMEERPEEAAAIVGEILRSLPIDVLESGEVLSEVARLAGRGSGDARRMLEEGAESESLGEAGAVRSAWSLEAAGSRRVGTGETAGRDGEEE